MDKQTIDEYKGQEREIDLINNQAIINNETFKIRVKKFRKGKVYLFLINNDRYSEIEMNIDGVLTLKNQILVAYYTIDKRDSLLTRVKNILYIVRYFAFKIL